jgi:hypothetical protein
MTPASHSRDLRFALFYFLVGYAVIEAIQVAKTRSEE